MKGVHFLWMLVLIAYSCKDVNPKEDINQIEQQLGQIQTETRAKADQRKQEMAILQLYKNVKTNLILCDNFEFVIRIDKLEDNSLRYICWQKPYSSSNTPSLLMQNGLSTTNTNTERQEYVFSHEDWVYAIEKIVPKRTPAVSLIFLEISNKNGKENYAWKMRDLTQSKYVTIH